MTRLVDVDRAVIDEIVGFTQPGQKIPFISIRVARRLTGSFRRNKTKCLKPVAVMPQHPNDSRGYRLPRSCRQGNMTETGAISFKPPHHDGHRGPCYPPRKRAEIYPANRDIPSCSHPAMGGADFASTSRISTCSRGVQATSCFPASILCSRSIRRRYPTRWFSCLFDSAGSNGGLSHPIRNNRFSVFVLKNGLVGVIRVVFMVCRGYLFDHRAILTGEYMLRAAGHGGNITGVAIFIAPSSVRATSPYRTTNVSSLI